MTLGAVWGWVLAASLGFWYCVLLGAELMWRAVF